MTKALKPEELPARSRCTSPVSALVPPLLDLPRLLGQLVPRPVQEVEVGLENTLKTLEVAAPALGHGAAERRGWSGLSSSELTGPPEQ
ncbi:hypothetical protein CKAH01_09924 [Colletotrichum kahawae]|uniref:Uncharacterized protein n=1 Tax=Colletotrichum kahawae TaxID=34407 RepID=A0AAD9XZ14_COLKA|nr:hypothetical protein CKAH01_09924 [Colletotrichum kahawae]